VESREGRKALLGRATMVESGKAQAKRVGKGSGKDAREDRKSKRAAEYSTYIKTTMYSRRYHG
jgi:hypothetical protein